MMIKKYAKTVGDITSTQDLITFFHDENIQNIVHEMHMRDARAAGVIDRSGQFIGMITERAIVRRLFGAAADVTEKMEAETRESNLRVLTAKLSSIIEASPHFTAFSTTDGVVTFLNAAALSLLRIDPESADGKIVLDLVDLLPEEERDVVLGAVRTRGVWQGVTALRAPGSAKLTPVELSVFPIDAPSREGVAGVALIAQDISLRKAFEAKVRQRERRLQRLTRQLLHAQEAERARMARELHDDVTQDLSLLAMEIGFLQLSPDKDAETVAAKLGELHQQAVDLTDKVRLVSHQYHPSVLDHSTLAGALESLVAESRAMRKIDVSFVAHDDPPAPREVSTVVYRIVQEALLNIAKHSGADKGSVVLRAEESHVTVGVSDDGDGFDPDDEREGLGLVSMQERAQSIGASLAVHSVKGEGTTVEVRAPLRIA